MDICHFFLKNIIFNIIRENIIIIIINQNSTKIKPTVGS